MIVKIITELCNIMQAIPVHQDRYNSMIDILLSEYYETCFSVYQSFFFFFFFLKINQNFQNIIL